MAEFKIERSDLTVEPQTLSPVVRELSIEISSTRVDAAYAQVVRDLRKQSRVKGFRPARRPRA